MTLSRREWLGSILGASLAGAIMPSGCAPRAREQRRFEGEFVGPSFELGHALRREIATPQLTTPQLAAPERVYDAVVVGGGVAGLSAARALRAQGIDDLLLLELEDEVGGTSIGGTTNAIAHPWGAHYLPVPTPEDAALTALLQEMGVIQSVDSRGIARVDEARLVREPDERLYYRGYWYPGLYPGVGESPAERAEHARFEAQMRAFAQRRDASGRRAFAIPVDRSAVDDDLLALDRVTASAWLAAQGFRSSRLLWYCDYACRDDFGLTLSQASAWAFVHYYAARIHASEADPADLITWPEGNFALVKHLRSSVGLARIQTDVLVTRVLDAPEHVTINATRAHTRQPLAFHARRAVLAVPHFIARRLVADLAPIEHASHGAWIVANISLSGRPSSAGSASAWDNVLYDSPSLGYVVATHATGRDHGSTVWTYYLPLTDEDPRVARTKLLEHTLEHWQDAIVADLARAHRDLARFITRVDVCRWGHAMVQPRVGALWAGGRVAAQAPRGRVHFAHSDLSGIALFEEAFHQGLRAAGEVATALRAT